MKNKKMIVLWAVFALSMITVLVACASGVDIKGETNTILKTIYVFGVLGWIFGGIAVVLYLVKKLFSLFFK